MALSIHTELDPDSHHDSSTAIMHTTFSITGPGPGLDLRQDDLLLHSHLIPLADTDTDDDSLAPLLTLAATPHPRASPLDPLGTAGSGPPTDSDLTGASMDGLDDYDDPSVADEMGGGDSGGHGGSGDHDGHTSDDNGEGDGHDWDADADEEEEEGQETDQDDQGDTSDMDSSTGGNDPDARRRVPMGPPQPHLPYPPSYALGGLPYMSSAAQVRGEAARMLRGIKHGLASAIRRGDLSPGAVHWTRRLHSFLDVKFDLPLSDRVQFINLYWELIAGQVEVDQEEMNPEAKFMEPALVEVWASMATRLLKKDQLLKPAASQLTFHWRPIYLLIKHVYHRRSTSPRLSSTALKSIAALGRLIEYSLPYAPASTASEVFHEFFPRLGLVDLGHTVIATAMLNLFLPPQHVSVAHIRALIGAWIGQFVHVPTLDAMFIDLLSNMVATQPPEQSRQWLTPDLMRTLASRGLRMLELPVGSSDSGSAAGGTGAVKVELSASVVSILLKKRNFNRTRIFARWLVMTIEWEGGLDHLKTVVKAMDSFTHPSNRGPWTGSLARFVRGVASEFAARLTETDPAPLDKLRLFTRPLVQLLRHPVLWLAHARDGNAANSAQGALRYLAAMDPASIMPMLLAEYIYPALGGVDPTLGAAAADLATAGAVSGGGGGDAGSQSHRLLAALAGMRSTVWALVHPTLWPPGPRDHLPEVLYLVLPGIDVNDANKTLNTLLFIAQVHACGRLDKVMPEGADDWLVEFLNKVLALLENIDAAGPQAHQPGTSGGKQKGPGGIEANMISALVYAVSNVVGQLNPTLFTVAANKMYAWARSRTLLHASNAVAQLVHAIVARDPKAQLPKWLAWLDEVIRDEMEHGAGMGKTIKPGQGTGEQGTATLLGYLQIVQQLALTHGEAVCATRDLWDKLLALLAPLANRDAFRQVQRTRAHLVASLSAMYPKDYQNTEWGEAGNESDAEAWVGRGELFPKPADVTYRWHVPSADEIQLAKTWVEQDVELVEKEVARLTAAREAGYSKDDPDAMDVDRPAISAFDEQHAWIKALSQLNYLVHSTSTWADAVDPEKKPSAHQRRYLKNNPVLETGPQVTVDTLRGRLVKLLEAAWQVFHNAGDARIAEKESSTTPQAEHSSAEVDAAEETKKSATAAPADPNLAILVVLLSATRTYLQTGRISSASHSSAMRSRKSLFRMPHGLAAGPQWDPNDADAGRQLGPKWSSTKALPRSLHIRRAHLIHLRRQKFNAHHLPVPARANQLVDKLYPHCLSNYTGVRRTTQSTLLTVAVPHIAFRRDLLKYVIEALTALPQNKTMDKDERSARIRAGLNLLRSSTLVRAISNGPQYTWPFMRALLTVAKHQDEPQVITHAHYLTVAFIMNVSTMSFAPLMVPGAVSKVAELGWERKPVNGNASCMPSARAPPTAPVATATVTGVAEANAVAMEEAEAEKVQATPVTPSNPKPLTPREKTAKLQAALDTMVRTYWTTATGQVTFPKEATVSRVAETDDTMDVDQGELDVTKVTPMHWRLLGTMMSLVSALSIRHDIVLRPDLVAMLMAAWIHDHTHIRQGAEAILLALQARLKYRAGPNPAKSLVDVDDALAEYLLHEKIDLSSSASTADARAPSFYIHEGSVGWLCFRGTINVYRMDPPAGPRHHAVDTAAIDAVRNAFGKPEWLSKLFHYMSLEQATQQGQVTAFHWNRSNQLRHLLAITGPATMLDALLPLTIAKLQASSDKASQLKCGLEFASALLRGSKHWPVADAQRTWNEVVPVWTTAMRASGPDTFRLFYMALRFVLGNRDPRMSQPLIQAVLEMARELDDREAVAVVGGEEQAREISERPSTPSSSSATAAVPTKASAFGVAKRLVYWRVIVESLGHRGVDDVAKWAKDSMIKMLHHPYKLVRDTLATLVADSMHLVYRPLVRSTDAWVDLVNASVSGGSQATIDRCMTLTKQTVDAIAKLPATLKSKSKEESAQAAKSIAVLALTAGNTARAHVGHAVLIKFLPIVYPLIPSDDPEAVELASGAITTAAHFDLGSAHRVREFIAVLMDMIKATDETQDRPTSPDSTSSSASPTKPAASSSASKNGAGWQIRLRVLRYIQVAFFRHLPILLTSDREWIVDQVASLLLDSNVEVRTLAGVTLAGLLQCSGGVRDKDTNEPNAVAVRVRHHADRLLSRGPLPKRQRGQPVPEGFADAVRHRHGGVVALAALVRAHPYTVPAPEVPQALVKLASYAEDPVPIGPTARSVFADFKRSHADSWHIDVMAFDEDQRSVMADMLVSPSYYA